MARIYEKKLILMHVFMYAHKQAPAAKAIIPLGFVPFLRFHTSSSVGMHSNSLPESDTSLWTREHKVFPSTNANNKFYQTDAYTQYMSIIENGLTDNENVIYIANTLPTPNKTYNYKPSNYGFISGSITFTLSFYGIHKQTNLPILLMTKEKSKIGYLFAKNTLTTNEPYRSQLL